MLSLLVMVFCYTIAFDGECLSFAGESPDMFIKQVIWGVGELLLLHLRKKKNTSPKDTTFAQWKA